MDCRPWRAFFSFVIIDLQPAFYAVRLPPHSSSTVVPSACAIRIAIWALGNEPSSSYFWYPLMDIFDSVAN
nr:MAG TPA: hypothetical protein [Caudoviricetes sp.]